MTNAPVSTVWVNAQAVSASPQWSQLKLASPLNAGAIGGTATVHAIVDAGYGTQVAKIFSEEAMAIRRTDVAHDKLAFVAMNAARLASGWKAKDGSLKPPRPWVSWPTAVLYAKPEATAANMVGFLMPRIDAAFPLTVLATPRHRAKHFPALNGETLLAVGQRIADQLADLGGRSSPSGILFTDLTPRNVLVQSDLRVHFIDADGFQFRAGSQFYPAQESTPLHRSPRIARAALAGGALPAFESADVDYALAILLFHLLVDGAHPWRAGSRFEIDGRSPDEEENMLAGRYPYGDPRTLAPPKIRLQTYARLPVPARHGFELAFAKNAPPKATDWVALLADARLKSHRPSKPGATPRKRSDVSLSS